MLSYSARVFFANLGVEACKAAFKLARHYTITRLALKNQNHRYL